MSYAGSDDSARCDMCGMDYPPGWPEEFHQPWPSTFRRGTNGRVLEPGRSSFHVCGQCLRRSVLATTRGQIRYHARECHARWLRGQQALADAAAAIRGAE